MLLVQLPAVQLHDPKDRILKQETFSFRISLVTVEMAKCGPDHVRRSAAEARLEHRCEVLAVELDHHGTRRMSIRSGKPGPDALPCELHGCKAPTTHVQVNRACACACSAFMCVDVFLVSCGTLQNNRVTESTQFEKRNHKILSRTPLASRLELLQQMRTSCRDCSPPTPQPCHRTTEIFVSVCPRQGCLGAVHLCQFLKK